MTATRNSDPFRSIAAGELDAITGGRIAVRKGPDPQVVAGIKQLAEVIAAVGQKLSADQAGGQQQMMQMGLEMFQKMSGEHTAPGGSN